VRACFRDARTVWRACWAPSHRADSARCKVRNVFEVEFYAESCALLAVTLLARVLGAPGADLVTVAERISARARDCVSSDACKLSRVSYVLVRVVLCTCVRFGFSLLPTVQNTCVAGNLKCILIAHPAPARDSSASFICIEACCESSVIGPRFWRRGLAGMS
jgi:hypothetical protein